ncbi:MAG: SsrA-binding protein SmpB [Nitrospinae bacterium]|nr:SsrA-binding protein SmpB [Nitrospinota bacterium]
MSRKTGGKEKKSGPPTITNRQAWANYHILDTVEAGIMLTGAEVKSIRAGQVNISDAHARVMKDEMWLMGMNVNPYRHINTFVVPDPMRSRKLLLHRKQIEKLDVALSEKGLTVIPLKLYFKKGFAKIELGVAKGKKEYDKREDIKTRDAKREMDRAMKR